MICTYFRSSSFNCHTSCEQEYFLQYVLSLQGGSGKKAEMGNVVHKALELVGLARRAELRGETGPIEDDALGLVSLSDCVPEILIDMSHEWHLKKSTHKWAKADYNNCKKWMYEALSLSNGIFDPRNRQIIDCEPFFDFVIDKPWAKFEYEIGTEKIQGQLSLKGTIDVIASVRGDTYEIIDWKTGQRKDWATGEKKTFDKLRDDPQLRIYHYAAHKLYPDIKKFIVSIIWIADGGAYTFCFDDHDLVLTEQMIKKKFEYIKQTTIPTLVSPKMLFKCSRVCHYGKNNWPGTNQTICQYIRNETLKKGLDVVTLEYGDLSKLTSYGDGGGRRK